jgi:hypothetical protein
MPRIPAEASGDVGECSTGHQADRVLPRRVGHRGRFTTDDHDIVPGRDLRAGEHRDVPLHSGEGVGVDDVEHPHVAKASTPTGAVRGPNSAPSASRSST